MHELGTFSSPASSSTRFLIDALPKRSPRPEPWRWEGVYTVACHPCDGAARSSPAGWAKPVFSLRNASVSWQDPQVWMLEGKVMEIWEDPYLRGVGGRTDGRFVALGVLQIAHYRGFCLFFASVPRFLSFLPWSCLCLRRSLPSFVVCVRCAVAGLSGRGFDTHDSGLYPGGTYHTIPTPPSAME